MRATEQLRGWRRRGLAVALALFLFFLIAARVDPASSSAQSAGTGAQSANQGSSSTNAVPGSHRAGSSARNQLANYVDDAESAEQIAAPSPAPLDRSSDVFTTLASSDPGASGARAPPADRTF
jgi:hypothetical protein